MKERRAFVAVIEHPNGPTRLCLCDPPPPPDFFNMNRIILQLFAIGFCFAVGQALECYKCKLGIWNLCLTTKKMCDNGEHCFSGVGKAASFVDIKTKGCLAVRECNQTKEVNFPESDSNATVYTMTKTCCNTDLCNAAPGLPGAGGLSLALATFTALFVALL